MKPVMTKSFMVSLLIWIPLTVLWVFCCCTFRDGQFEAGGWLVNCRPGLEHGYMTFVIAVDIFFLGVIWRFVDKIQTAS